MLNAGNLILWFFGQSAAGKAQLIRTIKKEHPEELLRWLGLGGYYLRVCEPSFCRPGKRQGLVKNISNLIQDTANQALLVKGQLDDLECGRPEEVRRTVPELEHRIVFVWCDLNELRRRWREERQWSHCPPGGFAEALKTQVASLREMEKDFGITCIDATKEYRVKTWPP